MIEDLLLLVAAVVIFAVLRSVIGIVLKGVGDFFGTASSSSAGPQPRPHSATIPTQEALKKDPVCGTFLPASNAVRKTVKGETYYFCSTECRDKFQG